MSDVRCLEPVVCDKDSQVKVEGSKGLRRRSFLKALGGVAGGVAVLAHTDVSRADNGWGSVLSQVPKEKLVDMYDRMLKSRWWETAVKDAFLTGTDNLYGYAHMSIGEEAIAIGVMGALEPDDYITSTHRGHHHLIAKGGDLNKMMAEIFFKETGYNHGRGGSMHICDVSRSILGMNGIVGPCHILAAGAAHAALVKGTKQIAVSFGGDGSVNNGWYYGALRNAALYKLPLVVVVENNGFQVSVPTEETNPTRDLSKFAAGLEIPGYTVDGQDVLAVYSVAKKAVDRARAGLGPTLIEAKTYRFYDHAGVAGAKVGVLGAFGLPYRSDIDVKAWIARDPLPLFRNTLITAGLLTDQQAEQMEADVKKQVAASLEFARKSPEPKPDSALDYVYSQGTVAVTQRTRVA